MQNLNNEGDNDYVLFKIWRTNRLNYSWKHKKSSDYSGYATGFAVSHIFFCIQILQPFEFKTLQENKQIIKWVYKIPLPNLVTFFF